jgi:hypothetical protein
MSACLNPLEFDVEKERLLHELAEELGYHVRSKTPAYTSLGAIQAAEVKARKLVWEQGREARQADLEARRIARGMSKKTRLRLRELDVQAGV